MISAIIWVAVTATLLVSVRYILMEFLNRQRFDSLQTEVTEKVFIQTKCALLLPVLSSPVNLLLMKGKVMIYHPIPWLKPRVIRFKEIKDMGLDTFTPSGRALNSGRVVKITLKKNYKVVAFIIKDDIEPWRAWIQSFGFRA